MKCDLCGGTITDREVICTTEFKGHLHIIEQVLARESCGLGERSAPNKKRLPTAARCCWVCTD